MSSVYTGVGGNVTQSTSPTETIPADGDNRNVASVNTALQKILDYIALIWAGAFTGQTSSTPGLQGTGGASAQGGKFTAGGGASPVKGMVNLVPATNAPSGADNGDIWTTSAGGIAARLNGVSKDILVRNSATSTSSGTFTTTSAGQVNVTNLSVTLTTVGRPVLLYLTPNTTTGTQDGVIGSSIASGVSVLSQFSFFRDATTVVGFTSLTLTVGGNGANALNYSVPAASCFCIDTPTAASHTWTFRAGNSSATSTALVTNCLLNALEL